LSCGTPDDLDMKANTFMRWTREWNMKWGWEAIFKPRFILTIFKRGLRLHQCPLNPVFDYEV